MSSFILRIAGLNIRVIHKFEFVRELCYKYVISNLENGEDIDFEVSVTDKDIEREIEISEGTPSVGYAEAICLHRSIAQRLPEYDAFLLHSAVIECGGEGYAFAAHSGVGKSTHVSLWKQAFGEKVRVINGDKPIIRMSNGIFYAYGTPWCGKEFEETNDRCPLLRLGFIERADENVTEPLDRKSAAMRLFDQILIPDDMSNAAKTLDLLDMFVAQTDFYIIKCNKEIDAAETAYKAMKGRTEE